MAETEQIAAITLTYNRIHAMNAIINAVEQTRQADVIYLMLQAPFPSPILNHSLSIAIREIRVNGKWPELWALKWQTALETITEPIAVLMDEDDRFEHRYIEKAVAPILSGSCDVSCNRMNIDIRNSWIGHDRCSVGTGTLAFRVPYMLKLWRAFLKAGNPLILREKGNIYPIDGPFYRFIENDRRMGSHDAIRYYFWHSKSQCFRHRKPKFAIDGAI